jgi:hypothetical protein
MSPTPPSDKGTETLPDDADAAREAARRLTERIRNRSLGVDVKAADEVKHLGLIAIPSASQKDSK